MYNYRFVYLVGTRKAVITNDNSMTFNECYNEIQDHIATAQELGLTIVSVKIQEVK